MEIDPPVGVVGAGASEVLCRALHIAYTIEIELTEAGTALIISPLLVKSYLQNLRNYWPYLKRR